MSRTRSNEGQTGPEFERPKIDPKADPRANGPLPDPPKLRRPAIPFDGRVRFWPEEIPQPSAYEKQLIPCPACRALYMEDLYSQAVVLRSTDEGLAYLRCRCCEHAFKLPIRMR